jgi:hypothetical protein
MKNLPIVGIFGVVSYLLSFGIPIPLSLQVFKIVAATAAMAGYTIGLYIQHHLASKFVAVLILFFLAILTISGFLEYVILIGDNPSGAVAVWELGFLLGISFFGFGVVTSSAGVIVGKL